MEYIMCYNTPCVIILHFHYTSLTQLSLHSILLHSTYTTRNNNDVQDSPCCPRFGGYFSCPELHENELLDKFFVLYRRCRSHDHLSVWQRCLHCNVDVHASTQYQCHCVYDDWVCLFLPGHGRIWWRRHVQWFYLQYCWHTNNDPCKARVLPRPWICWFCWWLLCICRDLQKRLDFMQQQRHGCSGLMLGLELRHLHKPDFR